jgi:hypothetical protein
MTADKRLDIAGNLIAITQRTTTGSGYAEATPCSENAMGKM